MRAYCEVNDKIDRIMGKLMRADLAPFLSDVHDRLSAPAELTARAQRAVDPTHATGDWLVPYRVVFKQLDLLLARLNAYSDGKLAARKLERLVPDRERDTTAIAEYDRCLAGWERADLRRVRVRNLEESLEHHRIVLGVER
jgi:hypothetical protein